MAHHDLADLPNLRQVLDAELAAGPDAGVAATIVGPGTRHDIAVGGNGLGGALTPESVVPWSCSSKPVGAIAFAAAWDRGKLRPDDLVAEHLPEFAVDGKDGIRVRDLLTHTTGIPDPLLQLDTQGGELPPWEQLEPLVWAVITAARPAHAPGSAMDYSPLSNWFVLDRLLAAVEGTEPGASYRATMERFGLRATLGVDPALDPAHRVRCVATPDETDGLERMLVAARLPMPGTGVWGTVSDLGAVGEVLLGCAADEDPVLAPSTVEAITATHWVSASRKELSTADFDYGLGFMTLTRLFGTQCSFRTYGHAGGNNSTLMVDPRAGVVIAVYWNRRLSDVRAVVRRVALVDAVYRDLGLTGGA